MSKGGYTGGEKTHLSPEQEDELDKEERRNRVPGIVYVVFGIFLSLFVLAAVIDAWVLK